MTLPALHPDAVAPTDVTGPYLAAHYGQVASEYAALVAGRGLVIRSDLEIVAVSGPDRQSWLTTLASNVVREQQPGQSRELLILDPNGRIETAAGVIDDGATTFLILDAGNAEPTVAFLESMRFMLRVEVQRRTDLAAVGAALQVGGDREAAAGQLAHTLAFPGAVGTPWIDPWPGTCEGGATYYSGAHPGADYVVGLSLVPVANLPQLAAAWSQHGSLAGLLAWEALRIERWRPSWRREVDARSVPHELDWLRTAVHLQKGCYRGQESVARIVNLGRPPRRLAFLHLDGSLDVLPGPGSPLRGGPRDREVGHVTSSVLHPELGPIALALLKRGVEPTAELTCLADVPGRPTPVEVPATQTEIVNVEGKSSVSPAQRPGAELRGHH
ncbi:YgfZ/GcvT domain-containing protein [Buchananella hordeovulneris]|uniref:Uncharacterized protein n=1 Tax=Buchananella hordeovulneris TaxID=52770 RepID=A0A1Q5PYC4_9ACTO|nr:folate-binding protein YgfZ [Buchananella hordeovulneris]OKL52604.1 hypothetical protein BSZ40_00345 [Buchananella hordeovulneris]